MKITEIFKKNPITFSFEFFPPKDEISAVDFGINVGQLMKLTPSFVTVTYGAGGSTQERTFALVDYLQNKIGLTTMAHYTCTSASRKKITDDLNYLHDHNIENLMLLRGDPPKGQENFVVAKDGFAHANELVEFAKKMEKFCIGASAYPEKHPESPSLDHDVLNLKRKVDAGADFLITQLFFMNRYYFDFVEKAKKAGINCRIIPGIIPITNFKQIKRFAQMSSSLIPEELIHQLEPHQDNPEKTHQIGLDFAIKQCRELITGGAPGIHFYTLNKSHAAVEIFEEIC